MYTDLPKPRQGHALILSLEGEAQDAALEIDEKIAKDDRIDTIIKRLDRLYLKDPTVTKYKVLEAFETFRRPAKMTILEFLNEFEKQFYKTKSYGTTLSDDILAYRLIKAANLSSQHEELIKATITDLKYDLVKDQLKKTFSDSLKRIPTSEDQDFIKVEETLFAEDCKRKHHRDDYFYDEANQRYFDKDYDTVYDDQELRVSDYNHEKINEQDTFYTCNRFSHRGCGRGIPPRPYMSRGSQKLSYPSIRGGLQTQGQTYSRGTFKNISSRRGRNPYDENGNPMTCSICESINHFVQNLP